MQLHSCTSSTSTRWETLKIMPRISGRSSLRTVSPIRLSPRLLTVARWGRGRPIRDRFWVTLRRVVTPTAPSCRRRRHLGQLEAARVGHVLGPAELLQALDGGVDDVDRVGGPERLGEDVGDPGRLEHGPDRAAGDDPGAGRGRLEQHPAGAVGPEDLVGDGRADHRHREEVLLGRLDALLDGRGDLLGLAVADADLAVAVAHDHEGGEREPAATLHDLGHAVDRDHALLELRLGGLIPAWAAPVVTGRPVSLLSTGTPARGWCHAECLLQKFLEIKAALAGRLGQRADASLVLVAATVEHHRGDAGCLGLAGQLGPDPGGGGLLVAVAG